MSSDRIEAVVLDSGSRIKVGFAGEERPRAEFPCVIGSRKKPLNNIDKKYCIGHHVQYREENMNLIYPMQQGIITDWNAMEEIWRYALLDGVRVLTEELPVLLTQDALSSMSQREKTAQIMFESLYVPAMYVAIRSVLSLYAAGRSTGTVVHAGEGQIQTVPVYNGHVLSHAIQKLDLGGKDLTDYMKKSLVERGCDTVPSFCMDEVVTIKENFTQVALNFEEETNHATAVQVPYTLPDGNCVTIEKEQFICPEILFQPNLIGKEAIGIDKMCFESIEKCDAELHETMYNNIVLSGGSTMFKGFKERMTQELKAKTSNSVKINVIATAERNISAWVGGSIFTSLDSSRNMWITKEEYDEHGSVIVRKRCF